MSCLRHEKNLLLLLLLLLMLILMLLWNKPEYLLLQRLDRSSVCHMTRLLRVKVHSAITHRCGRCKMLPPLNTNLLLLLDIRVVVESPQLVPGLILLLVTVLVQGLKPTTIMMGCWSFSSIQIRLLMLPIHAGRRGRRPSSFPSPR